MQHLLHVQGVLRGAILVDEIHLDEGRPGGLLQQRAGLAHVEVDAHPVDVADAGFKKGRTRQRH